MNKAIYFILLSALLFQSCTILESDNITRITVGEFAYFQSSNEIFRYSTETDQVESLLLFLDATRITFDINPNGEQLVVEVNSGDPESEIYIYDIQNNALDRLIGRLSTNIAPYFPPNVKVQGLNPIWSPDERYIAYSHESFDEYSFLDIYLYDMTTNTIDIVDYTSKNKYPHQWSMDSNSIFYHRITRRNEDEGLFRSNLIGENVERITITENAWVHPDPSEQTYYVIENENVASRSSTDDSILDIFELNAPDNSEIEISGFWGSEYQLLLNINSTDSQTGLITYSAQAIDLYSGEIEIIYTSVPSNTNFSNFRYINSD